ncbi:MAG: 50S ribosomal protein L25 [Candidatus Aminicenantaceae bacterium]
MGITIKCEKRDTFGKNESRRLRKEDKMPVIFYGRNEKNIPLVLKKEDIFKVLKSETGENTIFKISFGDSEKKDVMIRGLQRDPVTEKVLHADLVHIAMDQIISISVPVVTEGEAIGVKSEGGFVDFVTREVDIECLPKDIPDHIKIDITDLHVNQSFKVGDMTPPAGVKITSDPDEILINVSLPHEEEIEEEEVEEEILEGEEGPEVIGKEKEKVEEEEEKEEKEGKDEEKE